MTSSEKKGIFTLIGVMVLIMLIVLCIKLFSSTKSEANENTSGTDTQTMQTNEKYTEQLSDGTKINTSNELNNVKKYKTIEISKIQFTSKNENSTLVANVKNVGNAKFEEETVKVVILDENGKEIGTITATIPELGAGQESMIDSSITADVTNAKDIRIEAR